MTRETREPFQCWSYGCTWLHSDLYFLCGTADQNSEPQMFTTRTVPSEPSPQPLMQIISKSINWGRRYINSFVSHFYHIWKPLTFTVILCVLNICLLLNFVHTCVHAHTRTFSSWFSPVIMDFRAWTQSVAPVWWVPLPALPTCQSYLMLFRGLKVKLLSENLNLSMHWSIWTHMF